MNDVLHRLTNRQSGFAWGEFSSGVASQDFIDSPEVREVRALFGLDISGTDYYVIGALNTIRQHPELTILIPEDVTSYRIERYRPPGYQVVGGDLTQSGSTPPSVLVVPGAWPVAMESILTFFNSTNALLTRGAEKAYVAIREVAPKRLRLEWPEWSGFSGLLELPQVWGEGSSVEFIHTPCRYPHHLITPLLKSSAAVLRVVRTAGLMDCFTAAQRDSEKVAVVLTSLILATR